MKSTCISAASSRHSGMIRSSHEQGRKCCGVCYGVTPATFAVSVARSPLRASVGLFAISCYWAPRQFPVTSCLALCLWPDQAKALGPILRLIGDQRLSDQVLIVAASPQLRKGPRQCQTLDDVRLLLFPVVRSSFHAVSEFHK